jgi:hypothetical protein
LLKLANIGSLNAITDSLHQVVGFLMVGWVGLSPYEGRAQISSRSGFVQLALVLGFYKRVAVETPNRFV